MNGFKRMSPREGKNDFHLAESSSDSSGYESSGVEDDESDSDEEVIDRGSFVLQRDKSTSVWFEFHPGSEDSPPRRVPHTTTNRTAVNMEEIALHATLLSDKKFHKTFHLLFDADGNPLWVTWHPETSEWAILDTTQISVGSIRKQMWVPAVHKVYQFPHKTSRSQSAHQGKELVPIAKAALSSTNIDEIEQALILDRHPERIFEVLVACHVPKKSDWKCGVIHGMRFALSHSHSIKHLSVSKRDYLLYSTPAYWRNLIEYCNRSSTKFNVFFNETAVRWYSCDSTLVSFPVIYALAHTRNTHVFQRILAQMVVRAAWREVRCLFWFGLIMKCVFLVALGFAAEGRRWGKCNFAYALLIVRSSITFVDLILGFVRLAFVYTKSNSGLIYNMRKDWRLVVRDWIVILSSLACVIMEISSSGKDTYDSAALAWVIFVRWCDLMATLLAFENVGQALLPVVEALEDAMYLLVVLFLVILSGAHAHFAMCATDGKNTFWNSFLALYSLGTLGDFILADFVNVDREATATHGDTQWKFEILFLVYTGMCTILLLNVLIGVLSTAYDAKSKNAKAIFIKYCASIVAENMAKKWGGYPNFDADRQHLWITVPNVDIRDSEHSHTFGYA